MARSGIKHKIGNAHILAAMANAGEPVLVGDQLLYLGLDDRVEEAIVIKPKDYVVRAEDSIEDVDLDEEVVTVKGRRLTEVGAEQLARETLAEARRRNLIPGRKSLTSGSTHSPRVQFRVPEAIATQAQNRARAEGKSLSELAREALLRYLAS